MVLRTDAQGELELAYNMKYDDVVIPDAYERLILDGINGDQQHFVRRDELKCGPLSWRLHPPPAPRTSTRC